MDVSLVLVDVDIVQEVFLLLYTIYDLITLASEVMVDVFTLCVEGCSRYRVER